MSKKVLIRAAYGLVLLLCAVSTAGISLLLETKEYVFQNNEKNVVAEIDSSPFPVSVNPQTRTILEEDLLGNHVYETLAQNETTKNGLLGKALAFFSKKEWYQNLASPISRIIVIWPGERKEEIADNIGDILRWDLKQRAQFLATVEENSSGLSEGMLYPGEYVAHRGATPEEVASLLLDKFNEDILNRYTPEVEAKVPLTDALIIASLLEREASDFENMREISGVIWNRLFIDMPLQLDATLQYAKATEGSKNWWPTPKPADKYLKSPFNTYANKGLPPAPIANPSSASVLAALNPIATDCLYYFHDSRGGYHCSETYEEHVRKLKVSYGRGR